MKYRRLLMGVSIVFASAWTGALIAEVIPIDMIGGLTTASFICFFGGMVFHSGMVKK